MAELAIVDKQDIIIVVVDLQNPKEKYWGTLLKITAAGLWLKGLHLATFEDWLRQFPVEAYATEPADPMDQIGLAISFFPMHRVERVTLDEATGGISSYFGLLEQRVGSEEARQILEPGRTLAATIF